MIPKKLVRSGTSKVVKPEELETITDQKELNELYFLKIQEELREIICSDHKDINEFADLMQVAFDFAINNGFSGRQLFSAVDDKARKKGMFGKLALNNLNPNNPSNKLYFESKVNISGWVKFDFFTPETRPKVYGKYFVHRKDGKVHWETWNGNGWAYNGNTITHWQEVIAPVK